MVARGSLESKEFKAKEAERDPKRLKPKKIVAMYSIDVMVYAILASFRTCLGLSIFPSNS